MPEPLCHHRSTELVFDGPFPVEREVGDICGKPATHYSCNEWPREVCVEHKCRCPQPGEKRDQKFTDAYDAMAAILNAQNEYRRIVAPAGAKLDHEIERVRRLCPHTHKSASMVNPEGRCNACGGWVRR